MKSDTAVLWQKSYQEREREREREIERERVEGDLINVRKETEQQSVKFKAGTSCKHTEICCLKCFTAFSLQRVLQHGRNRPRAISGDSLPSDWLVVEPQSSSSCPKHVIGKAERTLPAGPLECRRDQVEPGVGSETAGLDVDVETYDRKERRWVSGFDETAGRVGLLCFSMYCCRVPFLCCQAAGHKSLSGHEDSLLWVSCVLQGLSHEC